MQEIRMLTVGAGLGGVRHPKQVYPVSDSEATELVNGGFAEYATIKPEEKMVIQPAEKEIVKPQETAKLKRGKK
jgi:hypothetical protein